LLLPAASPASDDLLRRVRRTFRADQIADISEAAAGDFFVASSHGVVALALYRIVRLGSPKER